MPNTCAFKLNGNIRMHFILTKTGFIQMISEHGIVHRRNKIISFVPELPATSISFQNSLMNT